MWRRHRRGAAAVQPDQGRARQQARCHQGPGEREDSGPQGRRRDPHRRQQQQQGPRQQLQGPDQEADAPADPHPESGVLRA